MYILSLAPSLRQGFNQLFYVRTLSQRKVLEHRKRQSGPCGAVVSVFDLYVFAGCLSDVMNPINKGSHCFSEQKDYILITQFWLFL